MGERSKKLKLAQFRAAWWEQITEINRFMASGTLESLEIFFPSAYKGLRGS